MSRALTDDEVEKALTSFNALHMRLRILSSENLKKLEAEARVKRPFCKHKGTCTGNAARGLVKAFFILYAIKYGLSFLPALVTGQIYRKPSTLLKIGGRDTISFALFLSSFISGYKGVLCGMRRLRGKSDAWNPFVAGCVAGSSLFLDSNKSRRLMVALYLSTRTCHFVCRWLWQRHIERLVFGVKSDHIPLLEEMEHPSWHSKKKHHSHHHRDHNGHRAIADASLSVEESKEKTALARIKRVRMKVRHVTGTIVMMLSSSQILYAYVCEPSTLAKSYLSFLLTHGGVRALQPVKAKDYLETMGLILKAAPKAESTLYRPTVESPELPPPLFESKIPAGLPVERILPYADFIDQVPHDFIMCGFQHPYTTDCERGVIRAFNGEWWRSLTLYAPLNAVMTLIFKGKDVLKHPKKIIFGYVTSTLRSCLFLTAYVTVSWCVPCYFRHWFNRDSLWMYYVNGLLAGAMVLIEAPGRRLELGMYCLPRALESLWNTGVQYKWVRHIPGGEGLYFCLATGVLMTLYQTADRSNMLTEVVSQEFTVGKVDAGMAILLSPDHHLIEFPATILPDGVTTGSIINLTIERNLDEERRQRDEFLELQQSIYEHFSQVPETPEVSLRSVTQTSATIQWKPLELNAADLRGIDIYKNSQKLSLVVPPGANSAKLSGLDVSHEYEVWIVVRTSSGHYHSNHITVKTHSLENLTGINVCFGALGNDGEMSNLVELLGRIGASYTEELTTDNTHLVCSFARGPKYEKALEWNIPAVSPEFLKACEQNGKVMPSFQYYLGP